MQMKGDLKRIADSEALVEEQEENVNDTKSKNKKVKNKRKPVAKTQNASSSCISELPEDVAAKLQKYGPRFCK